MNIWYTQQQDLMTSAMWNSKLRKKVLIVGGDRHYRWQYEFFAICDVFEISDQLEIAIMSYVAAYK